VSFIRASGLSSQIWHGLLSALLPSITSAARATSTSKGRQERDQVDPAVMPYFRRQRRPPSASCAGIQSRQLHAQLAMPKTVEPWSLTSLREKLIKIGAKIVSHGRYVTFQMAEVAVSRQMLADILSLISRLRVLPAPS
jgi:hypothetical protein